MLLLDTHAFIWLASTPGKLSLRAKRVIRENPGELYLSSISALEIGVLVKRKRLVLPLAPAEYVERALKHHGIQEIPLDRFIALASTALPPIHNDPFDRIIIATALLHDMSLLSMDRILPGYRDLRVLW